MMSKNNNEDPPCEYGPNKRFSFKKGGKIMLPFERCKRLKHKSKGIFSETPQKGIKGRHGHTLTMPAFLKKKGHLTPGKNASIL